MKAILEFNLNERDDVDMHALTLKAMDMRLALESFYNEVIRNKLKYGNPSIVEEAVWGEVKSEFFRILEDYEIEL